MTSQLLARVPAGGRPVYAFEPRSGSREFAVLASPEEYAAVMERGFATLDGIRADVVAGDCDPESRLLRLRLDQPYERPVAA